MKSLSNKVALVTGASSGIGRATALLFAQEGAAVVVNARRQRELDALVEEISNTGGHAIALAGDAAEATTAQSLVETAISEFGGLNICINNAGTMGSPGTVPDMPLDEWNHVLDINLTSAFLAAKYQLPALETHG